MKREGLRGRFGLAGGAVLPLLVAVLIGVVAGCDQLDPIKSTNLCEAAVDVSENCPQCLTSPVAPECPQCRDTTNPPAGCFEPVATNEMGAQGEQGGEGVPGTGGDAASGGDPKAGGAAASGGNAGRSGNRAPQGGVGNPSGGIAGGNGTQPGVGTAGVGVAGRVPMSTNCNDIGCNEPGKPGCLPSGICVQCTETSHCRDQVCDTLNTQCVGCNRDEDCKDDKVCEPTTKTCIGCRTNVDCKKEGLRACDTQVNTCVECLDGQATNTCLSAKPACLMQKCVECTADTNCPNDKPRCVAEEQQCVQCKESTDCARIDSAHPVCLEADNRCVECNADTDCKSPDASHCNSSTHACEPCSAQDQCKHISSLPVCDTKARKCVECDDGVRGVCGDKACILSTHKCSTVKYKSRNECEPCASRTECASAECVRVGFQSQSGSVDEGGRCLRDASIACGKPNSRTLRNTRTLDGNSLSVCAPSEVTSCSALLDARSHKSCSGPSACGLGRDDGLCPTAGVCTTTCRDGNDCESTCVSLRCQ